MSNHNRESNRQNKGHSILTACTLSLVSERVFEKISQLTHSEINNNDEIKYLCTLGKMCCEKSRYIM